MGEVVFNPSERLNLPLATNIWLCYFVCSQSLVKTITRFGSKLNVAGILAHICYYMPTRTGFAGSDKQINLFHLFTGELVATLYGHADIVMSLSFLPDLRHLVSVSYDSCVFVWRLAPELTALMLDRQQRVTALLAASATSVTDLPALGASPLDGSLPL